MSVSDQERRTFAEELGKELGGFTVEDRPDGWGAAWVIVHPDGRRLCLAKPWNKPERVEVTGCYPDAARDLGRWERFEITAAMSRGVKAVARDVKGRLLPGYEGEMAKIRVAVEQAEMRRQARAAAARAIAAALSVEPDAVDRDAGAVFLRQRSGLWGNFKASAGWPDGAPVTVAVEVHGLTVDQAERIAAILVEGSGS